MYSDVSEEHDTLLIIWLVIKWSSLIYHPLKMKSLRFFETMWCINFPQCRLKSQKTRILNTVAVGTSDLATRHLWAASRSLTLCCAICLKVISSLCPEKGKHKEVELIQIRSIYVLRASCLNLRMQFSFFFSRVENVFSYCRLQTLS